jgi:hypothetical protein
LQGIFSVHDADSLSANWDSLNNSYLRFIDYRVGAFLLSTFWGTLYMIAGVGVISIWDGFRSGYTFWQFFLRFVSIFTIYKLYDMICFDWFLLCKFRFFQYYYPEVESVYNGRKYGYNIKSQLLKLLVIFPAASAFVAWICSLL